jgi:uncharacterized protein (TIRG00374 family)
VDARAMKFTRLAVPLLLAALLIGGLVESSGLTAADLAQAFEEVSPTAVGGVLACTALFIFLSALKWRLVMRHVAMEDEKPPEWTFSLYYTSLGSVLALAITPHAAMVVSRSVGSKLHSKASPLASGAASAYEQMFDVVPLATMSCAAIIAMVLNLSFSGWLAVAAALNLTAVLAIILILRTRFWSLAEFVPLSPRRRGVLREKLEWFASPASKTLLGAPFVTMLFVISIARYAVILLRTGIVLACVGPPISSFQFLKAYGLARLSTLISITPGELGISEWTWSGVLTWMGFHLDDAARFVLVNRVYNVASLLVIFGFAWVTFSGSFLLRSSGPNQEAVRR